MRLKQFRWLHRKGFSRKKLRGGFLHRWMGDSLFFKEFWVPQKNSLARAWLVGCLIATSPFFGFHLFVGLSLAILLRANLPLVIVLLFTTNPLTAPFFYSFAFILGCWILNQPFHHFKFEASLHWLYQAGLPLVIGCTVIGLISGISGYFLISKLWKDKPLSLHKTKT